MNRIALLVTVDVEGTPSLDKIEQAVIVQLRNVGMFDNITIHGLRYEEGAE